MVLSSMEKPVSQMPQKLSPSSSGRRRRSSESNSPEFEFWMVRNPSCPQHKLLSADELFVDGVLLPLQLLPLHPQPPSDDPPDCPDSQTTPIADPPPNPDPKSDPDPGPGSDLPALGSSKGWRDIFKKSDRIRKASQQGNSKINEDKEKEKKKERKASGGGGSSSAELNINIWPFSRSRSAGNGGNRPRMTAGSGSTRKVSSAPCSRSNSAGESKSRKWPNSPSRVGVHLGRSSPVWQVRRPGYGLRSSDPVMVRNNEKGVQKEGNETSRKKIPIASLTVASATGGAGGTKARGLNLNVPMCIGYKHHLSCRSDESSAVRVTSVGGSGDRGGQSGGSGGSGDGGRVGNLFNLRGFFTKKVY